MKPYAFIRCLVTDARPGLVLASLALLPLLFFLDQHLPLGIAVGVLYVLPVLLTQWSLPCLTLIVTIVSSLLILADMVLSAAGTLTWMALLNRAFSLVIVWSTAGVVFMRQRAEQRVQASRAELGQKVTERTAHLAELNQRLREEVAERLQIEKALLETTDCFRAMVETTSDWVWELDAQGVYTYSSQKGLEFLGYTSEEVQGRTMMDFMPPDEAERFGKQLQSIYAARAPFRCLENVNRHRDGHRVVLETSGVPVFDADGAFRGYRGIDRDITERKDAERRLRESEQHLRQIIDLVPHRIFVKDADSRFLLANRAVAEVYGTDTDTLIGRRQSDLHQDPREIARMLADDLAVIESGTPKLNYEETVTDVNGREHVVRTTKIPYRIQGEDRPAVLGMAIDITDEKAQQQRLLASESKYRAVLENAVDAIFLADMEGRLLDANRSACELLGYTKEELTAMTARDLHPVEEHERLHQVFQTLANHGRTLVQHRVLCKDGQVIVCEVAATLIQVGDQYLAQGIFRDITERERRSKERLAQEQRHRDTLVREVHHRIKNNLQGVVGLLREQASAHPELADLIATAIGQVQSISVIYGLQGQGDELQVRLCDMVRAIARNTGALTRARVEPEVQLAIRHPMQVQQDEAVPVALIVNELILNAIKHGAASPWRPQVRVIVEQRDDHANVRVIGSGRLPPGFDYARGAGLGTGLGLVRSLLPHQGAELVFIESDQNVEARLRLSSPVVQL